MDNNTLASLILVAVALVLATLWFMPSAAKEPPSSHESYLRTRHFGSLDGLRAISVLGVIWCHLGEPVTVQLLNQGHHGVDLFFAISGFIVTTLLLREYRMTGTVSLSKFYIRRSLRIFPLYYAVLSLYVVLVAFTYGGTQKAADFWAHFPSFATYTSNWFIRPETADTGVTFYFAWSLATEEQFYLFWPPLLLVLLHRFGDSRVPAGVLLALVAIQALAFPWRYSGLFATILASLASPILFGALFAVLLHSRRTFDLLQPVFAARWTAPLAAALIALVLQADGSMLLARFLMAVLVAAVCVQQRSPLAGLLTARPVVFVGTISYGIYLMHMLAGNAARKLLGHHAGVDVFLLTAVIAICAAALSYRHFERPLLRLKARFSPGNAGAAAELKVVGGRAA